MACKLCSKAMVAVRHGDMLFFTKISELSCDLKALWKIKQLCMCQHGWRLGVAGALDSLRLISLGIDDIQWLPTQ